MLTATKFNKCKTCQQKITNLLKIGKHVLLSSYFYTHVARLLDFDTESFDTKYFFQTLAINLIKKEFEFLFLF